MPYSCEEIAAHISAVDQTSRGVRQPAVRDQERTVGVRRRCWTRLLAVCVLAGLLGSPWDFLQGGEEVVNRDQDVVLQVDSRWPGNGYGGYFPLRIRLSNMGQTRDLNLVFSRDGGGRDDAVPEVRRAVHIEQQATINFTLSIPMVSEASDGVLRVFDVSGEELKGLSSRQSLPDFGGLQPRTSILVISSVELDDKTLQPFEDAAATECAYLSGMTGGASASGYYRSHGYSGQVAERDHVVVHPAQSLPVNWIDYSGLDVVAVAWPDWKSKLGTAERDAILKWTATGGVLMLFGTEAPAAKLEELNRTLQLTSREAGQWVHCEPSNFQETTNIVTFTQLRSGGYAGGMPVPATGPMAGATPEESGDPQAAEQKTANRWKIDDQTYSQRDWSLGKIYVFPANPFPGTPENWVWWLSTVPRNLLHWSQKEGMSARQGNAEFLNFLIPGVGSVPIFAFLTLITLFTVVIGPLNYYWLLKRRRLSAMVFTVPLIAAVTCILLFAYSLIADGFSIRSRATSFTWLDQQRKSAVSLSRLCLYAPFAPSAGLNFPAECAVFPIWQVNSNFEGGVLDWSGNDQRLKSGWFRSQTWTQFQTVEHRDERGRLDYTPPSDPQSPLLTAANGLSWDLDYLAINTGGSTWYVGEKVPAGATAQLKLMPAPDVSKYLAETCSKNAWEYPPGIKTPDASVPIWHTGRYSRFTGREHLRTSFSDGLLQRNMPNTTEIDSHPVRGITNWRDGNSETHLVPHAASQQPHFWAVSRKNPALQTGVKRSIDQGGTHVLFGTF